jgi:hypothetical protein
MRPGLDMTVHMGAKGAPDPAGEQPGSGESKVVAEGFA